MLAALRGLQLFGLWLVVTLAGIALIALPRAVAPLELPVLTLNAEDVSAQEREDAELAANAPNTAKAKALMADYLNFGEAEIMVVAQPMLLEQRRRMLRLEQEAVVAESGPKAGQAMRALALSKFEAALSGELPKTELKGVLGIFPHVLMQHLVTRDGLELGPHFVVRTLYKARWNRMCGLLPEAELSQIERRAYFGWMGLHAANLPIRERRQALLGYAAAGGVEADQALGVLAFMDHDYVRAVDSLERAYAQKGNLRLRNYLRGARVAAGQLGEDTPASSARLTRAHN
ncbi:MAG TPA: hypothetical protein VFN67_22355 [Polyangiales bacterium]|nr:hypothetical protein [Polyangiales bacterium]